MKLQVAVTGASGFVATELGKYYSDKYDFIWISRLSDHGSNTYSWDEISQNHKHLAKVSCVINLAGANIGDKRWSGARKKLILDSRLKTTAKLVKILNQLPQKPDLLCASAVGIYPTSGVYDEYSLLDYTKYANFCESITKQWELFTHEYNGRVVNMRFGVVLSAHGGALTKILLPFKLGVGSGIADGSWSFSWISITDLCRAIDFLIEKRDINGVFNLVSPEIITYQQLIQTISSVYQKKIWFNLPRIAVTALFGQMGEELLLSGQKVIPKRLTQEGFKFSHPDIKSCLSAIFAGKI